MHKTTRNLLLTAALATSFMRIDLAQAQADPTRIAEQIAVADDPANPCTPGTITYKLAPLAGAAAQATGIPTNGQGDPALWTFVSCEVTLDPEDWESAGPVGRCRIIVHEVRHLGRHAHSEGGIMAGDASIYTVPFAPCDIFLPAPIVTAAAPADTIVRPAPVERALTLKQEIRLNLPAPARSWRITCTKPARKIRCRATSPQARKARRFIVYRSARVNADIGSRYSIDAL